MAISFMISALASRFAGGDVGAFATAHSYSWVVWEPGPWAPPSGNVANRTVLLPKVSPGGKSAGEALAMALKLGARHSELVLGRDEAADLPINDATLSRAHLVFAPAATGGWTVTDRGSRNGSWVSDRKLAPALPEALRDGARIQAGQVYLTFYDPAGLFARIRAFR